MSAYCEISPKNIFHWVLYSITSKKYVVVVSDGMTVALQLR